MDAIYQISQNELRQELMKIVSEIRAEEKAKANEETVNQLLTAEEVIQMLKISAVTLWRWSKNKYLSPIYIGGARKYRVCDVQAIIDGGNAL